MDLINNYACHPQDVKHYTTRQLRERFLVDQLMVGGSINGVYSHYDRVISLGIVPKEKPIQVPPFEEHTKADFFLQRREMGIINVGKPGKVHADGVSYTLANREILYVGLGNKEIMLESDDPAHPALFYINSSPAHQAYPIAKGTPGEANQVKLGAPETCNERTIYQQIHENGIPSCQLVMGFTEVAQGSVWNTFPPHTHERRMEAYFYFDLPENHIVVHFMGEPRESRHIAIHNHQLVLSPPWSIHAGAGTSHYSFVWGMAGENKAFSDMDGVNLLDFR